MTSKDLLAIVLGLSIPVALGLLTYAYQEREKRNAALSERRRELYESLIRSLVELLCASTGEERSRLLTEIEKSWLFASDRVLDASYHYLIAYDRLCRSVIKDNVVNGDEILARLRSDRELREGLRDRLAAVFTQMRSDIRPDTEITEDWARQRFDLYCWGILAPDTHMPVAAQRMSQEPTAPVLRSSTGRGN